MLSCCVLAGGAGLVNTMELNARVASAIGTPVMLALDARTDSTADSLVNSAVRLSLPPA